MFEDFDLIHSYTRKQAIEDGVLIDVSEIAKEAGFQIPVAITNAVWSDLIVPNKEVKNYGQSIKGRLWDTLMVLFFEIKSTEDTNQIIFKVFYLMDVNKKPETKELKALISGGDSGEPVITIMYKHED